MSPYFFVLCIEKLALLITEKVQSGNWMLVKVSRTGPGMSHLFFANDCLLFVKVKSSQVHLVSHMVENFCLGFGLKNNLGKSCFMASKSIDQKLINSLIVAMRNTTNFGKYLGLPVLQGKVKKGNFNFIIKKLHSGLTRWKGRLLNKP